MLKTIKDNVLILKESAKSQFLNRPSAGRFPIADALIRELGLTNIQRIIHGKPNTIVIVARDAVIRIPLDRLSETRCRVNKMMLKKLAETSIEPFVPRFINEGKIQGHTFYCEERLPGLALDIPLSKMDELVSKSADFITKFHCQTSRDIVIDESNFRWLFGREFKRLYPYLNDEYKAKLAKIEEGLKSELLGKKFKTVWFHGDYKVENVLFDTKTWEIDGVIDWDLSREEGLPLLDIFYLLAYNNSSLITKNSVTDIIKSRFLNSEFTAFESSIIGKYSNSIGLRTEFVKPMVIMFWLNHTVSRYQQHLVECSSDWVKKNVHNILEIILEIV